MKEVFGIWYRGSKELRFMIGVETIGIVAILVLMALSFWVYGREIPIKQPVILLGWLVVLLGIIFVIIPYVWMFRSINTIRKFKKEFGFLPPVLPEARDALQREVDSHLGYCARAFLFQCEEVDRFLEILKGFASGKVDRSTFRENVASFENALPYHRRYLKESKKDFWRTHAVASNRYLPQPFKVLKSVNDYKDVDFHNPAKFYKKPAVVDS